MKKVKQFFRSKHAKLSLVAGSAVSMLTVGAFANETTASDYSAATSALTSAITGLQTEAMSILSTVVGIAVVIMGGYWLIRMGMKWFKGLSK